MMVLLGIPAGLGAGAIDAGLNTYVAANFNEGIMQWLHAFWGVGTTTGPMIMTYGLTALSTWRFGYRVVGGFQIFLAVCFALTLTMWSRPQTPLERQPEKKLTDYKTPIGQTLRQPRVWLSMLLFILYVGAESSLGTWTFTLLTESRGVDVKLAGFLAGSYWLTFTLGRIAAGTFARRIGVDRLVVGGLIGALIGAGLLIWNPSQMANLAAVAVIGVSIAPIFPAMTSGTSVRVGDHHAANTIGIQMAATGFGTATITSLMGVLARRTSLEIIPVCLLVTFTVLFGTYFLDLKTRDTDPRRVEEPVDDFRPVP
jgi:fucose permease